MNRIQRTVKRNDYDHRASRVSYCRPRSLFLAHAIGSLGDQMRVAMRTMSAEIERRFATFFGLPYEDPVSRQQWEQVWEAEP
jgi:hypothetical protein